MDKFLLSAGKPYPLGACKTAKGFAFALRAPDAKTVTLCLFSLDNSAERLEIDLDPALHRTQDTWHIEVEKLQPIFAYGYKVNREPHILLDPYAKGIHAHRHWYATDRPVQQDPYFYHPLGIVPPAHFDWEGIAAPPLKLEELILYELHVRGFTQHASSRTVNPGTFLGVIEKIPHLKKLGINAVELMPIHEFNEMEGNRCSLIGRKQLGNYWGYSSVSFFAPMSRYAAGELYDAPLTELKTLVKELHRAGIAVILDVVYNHTAEGNHLGPLYSFKKLANRSYYIMNPDGTYQNHSGCGNTFNCNQVLARQHILDSLRYWVTEFHVDGFRFDLASVLTRGDSGEPLAQAPLLQEITQDPVLSTVKFIAEPWDMGLYQVGQFHMLSDSRWSEWNGRYRDSVRRFIAGHENASGEFATRLCGSKDLYWQGTPLNSLNFVTAHDGFTLADLVSYNGKHNQDNGEGDRDGLNENLSWNCGQEGPTEDATILSRRQRQMRNFLLALMLSRGIPMLSMGDEYGHTRRGNNNPWSCDDETNWFCWDQLAHPESQLMVNFVTQLIALRKTHPCLASGHFLTEDDICWHGLEPLRPNWGPQNRFVAFTLKGAEELYVAFNASHAQVEARLPEGRAWECILNTEGQNIPLGPTVSMLEHSAIVLRSSSGGC